MALLMLMWVVCLCLLGRWFLGAAAGIDIGIGAAAGLASYCSRVVIGLIGVHEMVGSAAEL